MNNLYYYLVSFYFASIFYLLHNFYKFNVVIAKNISLILLFIPLFGNEYNGLFRIGLLFHIIGDYLLYFTNNFRQLSYPIEFFIIGHGFYACQFLYDNILIYTDNFIPFVIFAILISFLVSNIIEAILGELEFLNSFYSLKENIIKYTFIINFNLICSTATIYSYYSTFAYILYCLSDILILLELLLEYKKLKYFTFPLYYHAQLLLVIVMSNEYYNNF